MKKGRSREQAECELDRKAGLKYLTWMVTDMEYQTSVIVIEELDE